jgi:hypothetical protein
MSSRDWLHVTAVGWLIVASPAHAQIDDRAGVALERPTSEENAAGDAADTQNQPGQFSIPVRIIEDQVEADRARNREQKSDQHEAADLEAQQRAAMAAERGAVAAERGASADERSARAAEGQIQPTWIGLIVAAIGTLALIYTLILTRRSVVAAINAASHTGRQADVAERAFRRLERPYLFLEIESQKFLTKPGADIPYLRYKITNHGKTPAIFKSIFLELCPMDEIGFLPNGEPRIRFGAKHWYEVLPTGGSTDVRSIYVKNGVRGQAAEVSLVLHGRLEYEDPTTAVHSYHFLLTREDGRFCLSYRKHHSEYPEERRR